MFRQVGGAIGVAAFVAIVGTPALASAVKWYGHGWYLMIIAATLGGQFMLAPRLAPPVPTPQPELAPAAA